MKLIRNSVFETNSSSCHSISVGKSGVFEGKSPDDDGVLTIRPQTFGWEQETYFDVDARLAYVSIYIRDWCSSDKKDYFQLMFNKVVGEHTGASQIEFKGLPCTWSSTGFDEGSIDHQSVEDGDLNHLFESTDKLKSFLFDKDSYIETDNDNH